MGGEPNQGERLLPGWEATREGEQRFGLTVLREGKARGKSKMHRKAAYCTSGSGHLGHLAQRSVEA